ncbi:MAG: VWA domain-containing protein [Candidatus Riflebacteria bacterium]|nr:VWA domain-containing protein [Candidatus Riflebacteria bacterium]
MEHLIRFLGFDSGALQAIESVRFSLAWGWAGLTLMIIAVIPIVWFSYRMEDKPVPAGLKSKLLVLKIIFIAGIILMLAGPRLTISGFVPEKNRIAVLIDSSRSMSITEENVSRMDRVRDVFSKGEFLEKLEKKIGFSPSIFTFSGQVAPVSREDIASFSVTPDGTQTNISKAISEIGGNLGEGNLLGMVMFTDGIHNTGENPIETVSKTKIPLYILTSGKTGLARDISISLDRPPSIGYLNSLLKVRGEIKAYRSQISEVEVTIKKDGKEFSKIKVPLAKDSGRSEFYFDIPCDTEGSFAFSASIQHLSDELTYENNEAGFLLKVIKDSLQVLFLSEFSSWDYSFMKTAVRTEPNSHITGYTVLNNGRWLISNDDRMTTSSTEPDIEGALKEADVLVLNGFPERHLQKHITLLRERLETGKTGIFIMHGLRPYTELGYKGSEIENWFPVDLTGSHWKGNQANMVLTSRDTPYSFLKLMHDPIENQEFFRTLPKFDGLFVYPKIRAGTEVLLSSTLELPGGPAPSLISSRTGQGRVAMLLGGPLWTMGFKLVSNGKGIKPYTGFVVNLLKWIANRREDAQVSLELPSSRLFTGQPVTFRVFVTDQSRQPLDNAQVTGEIISAGSQTTALSFLSSGEKGLYEATIVPFRRGNAEIRVDAKYQGKPLGKSSARAIFEIPTVEFDDPEVKVEKMVAIASISRGLCLPVDKYQELLDSIQPKSGKKRETKNFELRDSWLILLILLVLPLIEWIIRRRKGYS